MGVAHSLTKTFAFTQQSSILNNLARHSVTTIQLVQTHTYKPLLIPLLPSVAVCLPLLLLLLPLLPLPPAPQLPSRSPEPLLPRQPFAHTFAAGAIAVQAVLVEWGEGGNLEVRGGER